MEVHQRVNETVEQQAALFSTGKIRYEEKEKKRRGVMINVEKTDFRQRLAFPTENGGVAPLPNLREDETERDETQPTGHRFTEKPRSIGDFARRDDVKEHREKRAERIEKQETAVKFADGLLLSRLERRKDPNEQNEINETGAERNDL